MSKMTSVQLERVYPFQDMRYCDLCGCGNIGMAIVYLSTIEIMERSNTVCRKFEKSYTLASVFKHISIADNTEPNKIFWSGNIRGCKN